MALNGITLATWQASLELYGFALLIGTLFLKITKPLICDYRMRGLVIFKNKIPAL